MLTTPEAAAILGRDPSLVRRLARAGRLKGKKDGRDWLYEESDVLEFKALERKTGRPRKEDR